MDLWQCTIEILSTLVLGYLCYASTGIIANKSTIDIKPDNIFVDTKEQNGQIIVERVQLADVENAAYMSPGHAARGMQLGNYRWCSPESHAMRPIQKPANTFSFDIVVSHYHS